MYQLCPEFWGRSFVNRLCPSFDGATVIVYWPGCYTSDKSNSYFIIKKGFLVGYIQGKGARSFGAQQKKETKFGKEYIFFGGIAKTRIAPPNFLGAYFLESAMPPGAQLLHFQFPIQSVFLPHESPCDFQLCTASDIRSSGVPQGSVLGTVLFLVYCDDVLAIARRCGLGIHSYADDSQLYFHADPTAVDNQVRQLVACIEEISHWMSANRLKLNTDKPQFICLGTPHQLPKVVCDTITIMEALRSRYQPRLCVLAFYLTVH